MNRELYSNVGTDLTNELKGIYEKYLPKSTITFKNMLLGTDTIYINCYLAQNESELVNGYKENDMFSISFIIRDLGNGNYILENRAKSYKIRPTKNTWLYYERTELSFRKTKGNTDKITKSFEKFIVNLVEQLKKDIESDLIHDNFKELVREKMTFSC